MRVYFEDRSYAEIAKSPSRGKYFVTVGARQNTEIIVNSAEMTLAQLNEMLSDIPVNKESKPKAKPKSKTTPKAKTKKETKPKKKTVRKKRVAKAKQVEKPEESPINGKPLDGYQ